MLSCNKGNTLGKSCQENNKGSITLGKRKKTGYISVWFDERIKQILSEYAQQENRTLSNLIDTIILNWMKDKGLLQEDVKKTKKAG